MSEAQMADQVQAEMEEALAELERADAGMAAHLRAYTKRMGTSFVYDPPPEIHPEVRGFALHTDDPSARTRRADPK
jgi:hypothetical protein